MIQGDNPTEVSPPADYPLEKIPPEVTPAKYPV